MPSWRPLRALYAPDSYALVLLLILVTYALSTALTAAWATSLIVAVLSNGPMTARAQCGWRSRIRRNS